MVQDPLVREQFCHHMTKLLSQALENLHITFWLTIWPGGTNSYMLSLFCRRSMLTLYWLLIWHPRLSLGRAVSLEVSIAYSALFIGSYCKSPFYSQWWMCSASHHSTPLIQRIRANFAPRLQLFVSEALLHRKQPHGLCSCSARLESFWQNLNQSASKFSPFRRFLPISMLLGVQVGCHNQLWPYPRKKPFTPFKTRAHSYPILHVLVSIFQICRLISSKFKSPKYLSRLFMTIYPKTVPLKAKQLCSRRICQGKVSTGGFRHFPIGGNNHYRPQSEWRFAVLLISLFNCLNFYSCSPIKCITSIYWTGTFSATFRRAYH
jgi:hypothetical protein